MDDLERWTTSGAHWRVVDISNEHVVVDLCACTGEPMDRVESEDPAVIGYLRTAPIGTIRPRRLTMTTETLNPKSGRSRSSRQPPPAKPRTRGVTEIRGPYYTPMGRRYLEDVLETMGRYVDTLKFAGGSFTLMPRSGRCARSSTCAIATTCSCRPAASSSTC